MNRFIDVRTAGGGGYALVGYEPFSDITAPSSFFPIFFGTATLGFSTPVSSVDLWFGLGKVFFLRNAEACFPPTYRLGRGLRGPSGGILAIFAVLRSSIGSL